MEYYPRKIEEELDKWLERKEIAIIVGPRQSGKTTLMLHLAEKYGGKYVTLEDEDVLDSIENFPKRFAEGFVKDGRSIVFIDEAQYCKSIGKRLKTIFDLFGDRIKIFATGSGSFDIKVEVGRYLVGRAVYFELLPLSFGEFLMWNFKDLHGTFLEYRSSVFDFIRGGEDPQEPIFTRDFLSALEEYVIYGGYPAIVKEKDGEMKRQLLKNLVRTYLEKDVFLFLNVRHLEKFRMMLKYLCSIAGSILEISSIMRDLKMDYRTAEGYLSILTSTYVISLVPPFRGRMSTELKKAKKVYFRDTGLRNSVIGNFLPLRSRTDGGALLENFAYNELGGLADEIKYWRTAGKAEVDFILKIGNEIVPVEVGDVGRGFASFLSTYKPRRGLVIGSEFSVKEIRGTRIAFIPHFFI